MAYSLTPEQIGSITDPEYAFGSDRLLPPWEVIPEDFKTGNEYTKLASAIFYGDDMSAATIELNEGVKPELLNRCIRAHLFSYSPDHIHKIAGVGFMLACSSKVTPSPDNTK